MSIQAVLEQYSQRPGIWDEMHDGQTVRDEYSKVISVLRQLDVASLKQKEAVAGELFMNQGSPSLFIMTTPALNVSFLLTFFHVSLPVQNGAGLRKVFSNGSGP